MNPEQHLDAATNMIVNRARERFERYRRRTVTYTDRLFVKLFVVQWMFGILVAVTVSPYGWEGKARSVHVHVWTAVLLGGVIISLPIFLALKRSGEVATRHVIACAQMLSSALLIHLSGGRVETHFHVFVSLAFIAFYLDWAVLITGAVTISIDHLARGLLWPESVYGIVNPEWWRFLEHGAWVAFCVSILAISCRRHTREWLVAAEEAGLIEAMAESEWRETSVLDRPTHASGSAAE